MNYCPKPSSRKFSLRSLLCSESGTVMTEMLIAVPSLVFIFAITLHLASAYFLSSQMQGAVRVSVRQMAIGRADDEGGGAFLACSSLTGVSSNGQKSAEQYACDYLSGLTGPFSVSARDGVAGSAPIPGTAVTVEVRAPASAAINFLPDGSAMGPTTFAAYLTMQAQEPF